MSAKKPVRFRYRIIISDDTSYPYYVQCKGWFLWHTTEKERSKEAAEDSLRKCARLELMRPGSVVVEYTEQDFLVETLQGK